MTISEAMNIYFQKLDILYQNLFGTPATFPWCPNAQHQLFIGPADEDGDAPWAPRTAEPLNPSVAQYLCDELVSYYSSWYFLQLKGRIKNLDLTFLPFASARDAANAARIALADGLDYFPNERCVMIGTCTLNNVDDMLLFYDQNTGNLFIYDPDLKVRHPAHTPLAEIIANMEALI